MFHYFNSVTSPKTLFEKRVKDISQSVTHSLLNLLLQNKEIPFFLPANRIFILENADELVEQYQYTYESCLDF
ncbi:MAG: hypothetical protein RL329_1126 [Bacteroidota bacterium]|jgi:hypothetical protein